MQEVYFVAEFGDGDIIPSLRNLPRNYKKQEFSGHLALSFKDAVNRMNINRNNMNTWVSVIQFRIDQGLVVKIRCLVMCL